MIRQRLEFGSVSGFEKISGECFTLSADVEGHPELIVDRDAVLER